MAKKTLFAIGLILLGLLIGTLVITAYTLSGGKTSITLLFLALAVICIIAGSILMFSRLLDKLVSPVVEEISEDILDDIQDIKQHRMTNTIWMVILILIGALVFSFFVFRFHKMEAAWGSIPVIVPTFFGLVALAWFLPRTRWFQQSREYTPMWIFVIPTLGFIITLGVGLARTENMAILGGMPQDAIQYNTIRSAGPFLLNFSEAGNFALDFDLPKCDGDECAIILVIGLIVLVFVLVLGSATIPHFWLMSGSLLLGIMILITIHDLRIRPSGQRSTPDDKKPTELSKTPVDPKDEIPPPLNLPTFPGRPDDKAPLDKDWQLPD